MGAPIVAANDQPEFVEIHLTEGSFDQRVEHLRAEAAADVGLPADAVQLVATPDREAVGHFLRLPEYIDLGDFASQLAQRLPQNAAVKAATDKVQQALKPATGTGLVLQNATSSSRMQRATGVSIYFPHSEEYAPDYKDLLYSKDGRWKTFLEALFKA